MADDFGICPYSALNDQRVLRAKLTFDEANCFVRIFVHANDWGLCDPYPYMASGHSSEDFRQRCAKLVEAGLIAFYEVEVGLSTLQVLEIVGFDRYKGNARTRKQLAHRRQSELPLRDGTFPGIRVHGKSSNNQNESRDSKKGHQGTHQAPSGHQTGAQQAPLEEKRPEESGHKGRSSASVPDREPGGVASPKPAFRRAGDANEGSVTGTEQNHPSPKTELLRQMPNQAEIELRQKQARSAMWGSPECESIGVELLNRMAEHEPRFAVELRLLGAAKRSHASVFVDQASVALDPAWEGWASPSPSLAFMDMFPAPKLVLVAGGPETQSAGTG